MEEMIKILREHPHLRPKVQEIVSEQKDESVRMHMVQKMLRDNLKTTPSEYEVAEAILTMNSGVVRTTKRKKSAPPRPSRSVMNGGKVPCPRCGVLYAWNASKKRVRNHGSCQFDAPSFFDELPQIPATLEATFKAADEVIRAFEGFFP